MRAYLKIWGNEYPAESINWRGDGCIHLVSLHDENEVHHTVFDNSITGECETSIEDRYSDVLKYTNLQENVIWKEK